MRHKQTAVERDADLLEVMKQQAFSLPSTEIFKADKKPTIITAITKSHKPINMPTPKQVYQQLMSKGRSGTQEGQRGS